MTDDELREAEAEIDRHSAASKAAMSAVETALDSVGRTRGYDETWNINVQVAGKGRLRVEWEGAGYRAKLEALEQPVVLH